jgi:hypothetical protein
MGLMNDLGGVSHIGFFSHNWGVGRGFGRVMACALNRFLYFLFCWFSAFANCRFVCWFSVDYVYSGLFWMARV